MNSTTQNMEVAYNSTMPLSTTNATGPPPAPPGPGGEATASAYFMGIGGQTWLGVLIATVGAIGAEKSAFTPWLLNLSCIYMFSDDSTLAFIGISNQHTAAIVLVVVLLLATLRQRSWRRRMRQQRNIDATTWRLERTVDDFTPFDAESPFHRTYYSYYTEQKCFLYTTTSARTLSFHASMIFYSLPCCLAVNEERGHHGGVPPSEASFIRSQMPPKTLPLVVIQPDGCSFDIAVKESRSPHTPPPTPDPSVSPRTTLTPVQGAAREGSQEGTEHQRRGEPSIESGGGGGGGGGGGPSSSSASSSSSAMVRTRETSSPISTTSPTLLGPTGMRAMPAETSFSAMHSANVSSSALQTFWQSRGLGAFEFENVNSRRESRRRPLRPPELYTVEISGEDAENGDDVEMGGAGGEHRVRSEGK
jgi:uncharacterized membrane protein YgcG